MLYGYALQRNVADRAESVTWCGGERPAARWLFEDALARKVPAVRYQASGFGSGRRAFPESAEVCCFGDREAKCLHGRKASSCVACSGESAMKKELLNAFAMRLCIIGASNIRHSERFCMAPRISC